ncbi:hypothetical protein [Clostridium grantii]|uniref:Uncharacterized protein n=1 Tax=Clostridium grantii DSM 8605 TaxID=1121316 RepID=A0A1M5X6M8_9CLOT|nr:hypothetical protein [Clostridium grantii]SHH94873.1 hypothetical protein SAMN02745207_03363 [Clostridium grantii DSM 8605]
MRNTWKKSFKKLIIISIYLIIAVSVKSFINELKLKEIWDKTHYMMVLLDFVFYSSLGVMIALINGSQYKRKRKMNFSNMILLVVPCLFLSLSSLVNYLPFSDSIIKMLYNITSIITLMGDVIFIYQILFGYFLINSFE